jgi:hypothetical protein
VGRDEIGRVAMDGAGPIAILEAPAGPPGHLEASAGLRPPPDQQAATRALTCLATRIKRPRPRPRPTKIAMEGRVPKGRSDGVWALGAAGTNSFQQSWLTEADRLAEGGCQGRQGKSTDKHILKLRMRPRARAPAPGPGPACACLCSSSVGPPGPCGRRRGRVGGRGRASAAPAGREGGVG